MSDPGGQISVHGVSVELPDGVFEAHDEPRTLIRFRGPVRDEWKDALRQAGVRFEFWCPPFGACVTLPEDLRAPGLAGSFPFLASAAPYREENCDRGLEPQQGLPLPPGLVDIVSFGKDRREAVEAQLRERGIEIVASASSKIRVRFGGDLKELRDLAGVKLAGPARASVLLGASALALALETAASDGSWIAGLDGRGEVIAVTDTGLDAGADGPAMHADFRGRLRAVVSWPVNPSWAQIAANPGADDGPADTGGSHGTHVAGLAAGNGSMSGGALRGVAPEAELVFQAIEQRTEIKREFQKQVPSGLYLSGRPLDLRDLFRQAREFGARIHVNSWGDPASGGYTDDCFEADLFLRESPDAVVLFAAGNEGADRDGDGQIDPGSLYAPASAKNVIAIGATEGPLAGVGLRTTWGGMDPARRRYRNDFERSDAISGEPDRLALFSSAGPTRDLRIKPDCCAPGSNLASARSQVSAARGSGLADPLPYYMYDSGTSMANGVAGGALAVIRQVWRARAGHAAISGAALKALVLLGAQPVRGLGDTPAPARCAGFGRISIAASLPERPDSQVFLLDDAQMGLRTGDARSFPVDLAAGASLRAVLTWYDAPGERLINDLDLSLIFPDGTVWWGNRDLSGVNAPDRTNTVERIVAANLAPGRYTICVSGFNVPESPQLFALAIAVPRETASPFI